MKKFFSMFAFVAAIVLGALSIASCGNDDDDFGGNTKNVYKMEWTIESKRINTPGYEELTARVNDFVKERNEKAKDYYIKDDVTASSIWSIVINTETIAAIQEAIDEEAEMYNDPTLVLTCKLTKDDRIIQKQVWRPKNWDII